ncbi:uncharacterized protein LOC111313051 [Durio zibethinus]|uniref:Uncharacterized protein LOC111313051 n=1 Tax=Durio zibethinus TaxID=66656 RepID=A0A6P6AX77_DURZI|nr:uncharacterized protein LOC111313051 [Durio zibethinus]
MEEMSKTSMASISTSRDKNMALDDQNGLPMLKKRKRSAGMRFLKAVLYMLQSKSSKSKSQSIQVNVASNFSWKGLVGSMRPMHLQSNQSPPPPIDAKPAIMPELEPISVGEQTEEPITPPLSPMTYFSPQSPSSSISSTYGSANDLTQYDSPSNQEIHVIKLCEGITEQECRYDDEAGDEMIDAKAEEFIANFYHQMRLQNLN